MFNVGDEVYYLGEPESKKKYKCIVISSDRTSTRCHFFATGEGFDEKGKYYGEYAFRTNKFQLKQSALPKEQLVALKCKTLWNRSSWVKKNPSLAIDKG